MSFSASVNNWHSTRHDNTSTDLVACSFTSLFRNSVLLLSVLNIDIFRKHDDIRYLSYSRYSDSLSKVISGKRLQKE